MQKVIASAANLDIWSFLYIGAENNVSSFQSVCHPNQMCVCKSVDLPQHCQSQFLIETCISGRDKLNWNLRFWPQWKTPFQQLSPQKIVSGSFTQCLDCSSFVLLHIEKTLAFLFFTTTDTKFHWEVRIRYFQTMVDKQNLDDLCVHFQFWGGKENRYFSTLDSLKGQITQKMRVSQSPPQC